MDNLNYKRWLVISGFVKLGFKSKGAFFNVCKSVLPTLNGFKLLAFWKGGFLCNDLMEDLINVLEIIKYE